MAISRATGAGIVPSSNSHLERIAALFCTVEDALLVLLLAGMIGLAATQIALRNVFDTGIAWSDPLLRVTVMWVGLLGAMVATRQNEHISIDILTRHLSGRAAPAARAVSALFAGVVCATLSWHGARFVRLDWEAGTIAFAEVPAWLCELIIPIGFGVMAMRFLAGGLSDAFRGARGA